MRVEMYNVKFKVYTFKTILLSYLEEEPHAFNKLKHA